jgi:hypothetical protein
LILIARRSPIRRRWPKRRTADRLLGGTSITARIVSTNSYHSLRLGRFAELAYTVGEESFTRTVRYDGPPMQRGWVIPVRVDPDDPRTLVVLNGNAGGRSIDLWLQAVIGHIVAAAGLAAGLVFVSNHQWRFAAGE